MQYKVSPIDHVWSPIDVPLIILWKTNSNGSLKLPTGVLSLVPYCPIWGIDPSMSTKRQKFIIVRVSKYIDF
jgi:hypothetical protein